MFNAFMSLGVLVCAFFSPYARQDILLELGPMAMVFVLRSDVTFMSFFTISMFQAGLFLVIQRKYRARGGDLAVDRPPLFMNESRVRHRIMWMAGNHFWLLWAMQEYTCLSCTMFCVRFPVIFLWSFIWLVTFISGNLPTGQDISGHSADFILMILTMYEFVRLGYGDKVRYEPLIRPATHVMRLVCWLSWIGMVDSCRLTASAQFGILLLTVLVIPMCWIGYMHVTRRGGT